MSYLGTPPRGRPPHLRPHRRTLLAFGVTLLFGFEGELRHVLILGTAVPTAVNTALLAHELKADSSFAASAVFYLTLLNLITVTVILAIMK